MSKLVVRDAQAGFRGGLNTAADESALEPDEARRLENFLLNEYGAAIKRKGTRIFNTTAIGDTGGSAVLGGYDFRTTAANQNVVCAFGKIYTFTHGTPAVTVTLQTGTMETAVKPDFAQFIEGAANEKLYIADGGTGLNSWDGTTFSANIASTPAGITRLAVYNQRLFGVTGADQTLWWSGLNDGDSLGVTADGGGEAVIRTFGDQRITGLSAVGDSLLIWHVSGISRFTGWTQDDINIAAGTAGVTSDVGTIAPRTIVGLESEALFLTERGFYSVGANGVQPISSKIEDQVSGLSEASLEASFGIHFRSRREVWFYVGGLGFYVFSYRLRSWAGPLNYGFTDPVTTCAWEALNSSGVPVVMVGDEDGYIKQVEYPSTYLDNVTAAGTGGTGFTGTLQFRRMFTVYNGGAEFEAAKTWRWGYLLADPRNADDVTITWVTGYGGSSYSLSLAGQAWGTGTWGTGTWGGGGVQSIRIPLSGRGSFVDFTIEDASEASALYSRFSIDAFRMSRRG